MKKKFIIIIGLFLLLFITGYTLYKSNIFQNNFGKSKSGEFNYIYNLEGDYKITKDGKITEKSDLKIENGGIISTDNGLKQRISLGNLTFASNGEYTNSGSIKDLDIVTDNEKIYSYLGEGKDSIMGFYDKNIGKSELLTLVNQTYGEKKYAMFDNSKPIIKALGELSKNELIKNIAISLSTGNYSEYMKKTGADKQLNDFLKSDKVIDLLFKDGEKSSDLKKINLLLNENNCKILSPIIENIINDTELGKSGINITEISKSCEELFLQANSVLPMITQIYKEGDITNGNFKFVIAQGTLVDLKIDYKNHIIDTWSINSKLDKVYSLSANGDKQKIISSLLKLDIDSDGNKITGEIKDGEGKIDINGKVGNIKTTGFIRVTKYIPNEINITGKGENTGNDKTEFSIIGDNKSGKISINIEENKEKGNIDFNYTTKGFDLVVKTKDINLKSNYENSKFNLDYLDNDDSGKEVAKANIVYDSGKIDLIFKDLNNTITIKTEEKSKDDVTYTAMYEVTYHGFDDKETKKLTNYSLNIRTSKKDGFIVKEFIGKSDIPSQKLSAEFNLKYSYKQGGFKYEIPKNYKEIDIKIGQMISLPNLSTNYKDISTKKFILVGATALGIGGTIAYLSLQGYSIDARNSKRTSDISNIQNAIVTTQTKGTNIMTLVTRNKDYQGKQIYIGGSLVNPINYIVGTLNYTALGIRGIDFKDPDGSEYIIGVTSKVNGRFEVVAKMENGKNKTYMVSGNYIPRKSEKISIEVIGSDIVKLSNDGDLNKLYVNDMTNLGKIIAISSDLQTITIDNDIDENETEIYLLEDEPAGLIYINGKAITNGMNVELPINF